MAKNVTAQVLGGSAKVLEVDTVQDAYNQLKLDGKYTATINGEPADLDEEVEDYAFISFSAAVKGGL